MNTTKIHKHVNNVNYENIKDLKNIKDFMGAGVIFPLRGFEHPPSKDCISEDENSEKRDYFLVLDILPMILEQLDNAQYGFIALMLTTVFHLVDKHLNAVFSKAANRCLAYVKTYRSNLIECFIREITLWEDSVYWSTDQIVFRRTSKTNNVMLMNKRNGYYLIALEETVYYINEYLKFFHNEVVLDIISNLYEVTSTEPISEYSHPVGFSNPFPLFETFYLGLLNPYYYFETLRSHRKKDFSLVDTISSLIDILRDQIDLEVNEHPVFKSVVYCFFIACTEYNSFCSYQSNLPNDTIKSVFKSLITRFRVILTWKLVDSKLDYIPISSFCWFKDGHLHFSLSHIDQSISKVRSRLYVFLQNNTKWLQIIGMATWKLCIYIDDCTNFSAINGIHKYRVMADKIEIERLVAEVERLAAHGDFQHEQDEFEIQEMGDYRNFDRFIRDQSDDSQDSQNSEDRGYPD